MTLDAGHRGSKTVTSRSQPLKLKKQDKEKHLQFYRILTEISSLYTNLPANKVDETIKYGLQLIGKFLEAERCNLIQFSENRKVARVLNSWGEKRIGPLPEALVNAQLFVPWTMDKLKRGEIVKFSALTDLPHDITIDRKNYIEYDTNSLISVPIPVGGSIVGAISVGTSKHIVWPEEAIQQLRLFGEILANAVARKQKELEIQDAFLEIKKLKDQLEADCTYLREEIESGQDVHKMIGQSDLFKSVFLNIQQIAPTDITVLICGETGTGKELVARAIHAASNCSGRPMVIVNCAALPANLIESELFGHEKGAFTSAQGRQVGRFELADGNSLFLDEIGELPMESQAKLLRVLQDGEFERLGSSRTIKVNVRIIAATNRNLEEEVRQGRFRRDLWYRLNVFPITIPPLRSRKGDIPLLSRLFVDKCNRKLGKRIEEIPPDIMDSLQNYHWPGNVRELENIIERAVIKSQGKSLQMFDKLETSTAKLFKTLESSTPQNLERGPLATLEETERNQIVRALEESNWRIYGPKGAAVILGINSSTLRHRMRKLGIEIQKGLSVT